MNFVYGLMLLAAGFAFIKFSRAMNDFFAVPTFGIFSSGHQAYRMIGVIMIILSPMIIFSIIDISSNNKDLQQPATPTTQENQGIQLQPR